MPRSPYMPRLLYLIVFLVIVLFFVQSTRGPRKRSPRELLLAIASAGYEVTKGERITDAPQGAEFAFWIEIDGDRVAAYRFDSLERATEMAGAFQQGFDVGYWAFERVGPETRAKIAAALRERPLLSSGWSP